MQPTAAAKTKAHAAILRKAAVEGHVGAAGALPPRSLASSSEGDAIADASGFHLSRAVGRHNNGPPWWAGLL